MAKVQLKTNWSGYPPGSIVTVSDIRGKYLVDDLKIARYTPGHIEATETKENAESETTEATDDKAGAKTARPKKG